MSKLQQKESVKKPGKKPLVEGIYDSTTVVYQKIYKVLLVSWNLKKS